MLLVTEYLLRSDRNVVLDGTFYKRGLRSQVYSVAKKTGAKLAVVECKASGNNIKRRMGRRANRKNDPSDANLEVYKKIKQDFQPIKRKHLVLDTAKSKQSNQEELVGYMKQH
jgi:predicted kinase